MIRFLEWISRHGTAVGGGAVVGYLIGRRHHIRRVVQQVVRTAMFKSRFPVGCMVRIKGTCCEQPHNAGKVVQVKRHVFTDRWEVRFDLPETPPGQPSPPWGCCSAGMEHVG